MVLYGRYGGVGARFESGCMTTRVFFHRTNRPAAATVLVGGFRDSSGNYMTEQTHAGVWLSDVPLDGNEGAMGDVLLLIIMALTEAEQDQYEWVEEGKQYREWLFPATLINERATILEVTPWESQTDFERKVAELKTEVEKLPADRQDRLRRELDEGKEH